MALVFSYIIRKKITISSIVSLIFSEDIRITNSRNILKKLSALTRKTLYTSKKNSLYSMKKTLYTKKNSVFARITLCETKQQNIKDDLSKINTDTGSKIQVKAIFFTLSCSMFEFCKNAWTFITWIWNEKPSNWKKKKSTWKLKSF